MKRIHVYAVIKTLAAPLLLAALLSSCGRTQGTSPAEPQPFRIETAEVAFTSEPVPVEAPGILSRRQEAVLSFKTGGVIGAVNVRAGDRVTGGQELASLRLEEIDAQVAQASVGLEKARRDLARARALQAERVATLENLEDAQTAFDVAAAGLRAAQFNRAHSVIVAPGAGTILRRAAEPDELAGAGRPILVFAGDEGGWIVRAGISEPDVVRLRVGDAATLRAGESAAVAASVSQIAEGADAATRTVEVELTLGQAPAQGWRSGFIVQVSVSPQPGPGRSAVPLSALVEGRGKAASVFVLSADGRSVHRQEVEIDALHGERAYLRTTLPRGVRVATTGAEFLTDGRAVVEAVRRD